nr:PREDICTED: kielin/chordin-like protein [Latimeria chalumnae]|eukprot:XP_014351812.1 PREDICTED: kielin/chordin-like protein [Latimeria chalumnae]
MTVIRESKPKLGSIQGLPRVAKSSDSDSEKLPEVNHGQVKEAVTGKARAIRQKKGARIIDLLEALNITRSIKGVSKAKGLEPEIPAWKFRNRVPHLTLPRDYSIYFLSTTQGSIGFHFVAKQTKNSEGTLLSFVSPAAMKKDGHPLLQLVSSTKSNQLRFEYRDSPNLEPASILFPGGTPFAGGKWARVALNVEAHKVTLFTDCEETIIFEKGMEDELISLTLPIDLEITFASTAGDKTTKFLGYWQTAEISPTGFTRRPWHCPNLPDSMPLPYSLLEERFLDAKLETALNPGASLPPEPLLDIRNYQQQQSEPEASTRGPRPRPESPDERIQRLEDALDNLVMMLDMVKAQNTDLLVRVKYLEGCECRRPKCSWEGREYEEGSSWDKDKCSLCSCVKGEVRCLAREDRPQCVGCSYDGVVYKNGDSFTVDSCNSCICLSGDVSCSRKQCEEVSCDTPVYLPGECCPRCPTACSDGHVTGETWIPEPCKNCTCLNGEVQCFTQTCLSTNCQHPIIPRGKCCPECTGCVYNRHRLRNGQTYQQDRCTKCTCRNGNVQCQRVKCLDLACLDQFVPPGKCCPVCRPGCKYEGKTYENGDFFLSLSNPCMNCSCRDSLVRCFPMQCQQLSCASPIQTPGQCCPSCPACDLDGEPHEHGTSFTTANGCQMCQCLDGRLSCRDVHKCPRSCTHGMKPPFGSCCRDCSSCDFQGQLIPDGTSFVANGDVCDRCVCKPRQEETVRKDSDPRVRVFGCVDGGIQREHTEEWRSPGNPCRTCKCLEGQVQCEKERCITSCRNPSRPRAGECCPTCDGCLFNGREYRNGEGVANGDPCANCTCMSGDVLCDPVSCRPALCRNPVQGPGDCCPRCNECRYDSQTFADGQVFVASHDPCLSCRCTAGEVSCDQLDLSCPPVQCSHPGKVRGQCCPTCDHCEYENEHYTNGQTFTPPGSGPCLQCTCQALGNPVDPRESVNISSCIEILAAFVLSVCLCSSSSPSSPPSPVCVLEGLEFEDGTEWEPDEDPCSTCVCLNGDPVCQAMQCPSTSCLHPTKRNGCNYAGKEYPNGAEFPHPTDKCRECHCINGNVQCLTRRCPPLLCNNPFMVPGECCPQCPAAPAECLYMGLFYRHMERFYDPSDKCRSCICNNGTVTCQRKPCAPILCTHPLLQDCCRTCDGCLYNGKELANGEQFPDASEPCNMCVCQEGSVACDRKPCPVLDCPFPVKGQCCAACEGCEYLGEEYLNGQEFVSPREQCTRCSCVSGFVSCSRKPCYNPGCAHPITLPGHCCPLCEGCFYNGVAVNNRQTFPDPSDPQCSQCSCRSGSVHCMRKVCAPAPCPHPVTGPCDCPLCDGCRFQGRDYLHGETFPATKGTCEECRCLRGEVTCSRKTCPKVSCPHPAVDLCACPVCDGCSFHGRDCLNGERFPDPDNQCNRCTCLNGGVTCVAVTCPPTSCRNPITRPGECCPQCTGVCRFQGRVYNSGATFDSPADQCSKCNCLNEVVTCVRKSCPQQCSHPVPSSTCCPACNHCFYEGHEFENRQAFSAPTDSCQRCSCLAGNVLCTAIICPQTPCANPISKPGFCCAECPVCSFQGVTYSHGEAFLPDPCRQCTCRGGSVHCLDTLCPRLSCMHQVTEPGICCPRCRGCIYNGKEYRDGSTWFASTTTPCMSCMCVDGVTTCSEIRCVMPCVNQVQVPGECCPLCADCIYNNKVYGPEESFQPADDPCEICTCQVMSDGEQHLRCYQKQCPSLVDCPKNHIHLPGPDQCCPTCAQPLSNCTVGLVGNEVYATDNPCYTCHCKDLTWVCIHQGCPQLSCPITDQFTPQDSCCPICDECVIEIENRRVSDGESWTDSSDDCISCTCNVSVVTFTSFYSAFSSSLFFHPNVSCLYQGQQYQSNEHWEVDECTTCTCVSGEVHCQAERCPQVSCASDETPALIPGMCCPHCIPRPATCTAFGDPHYRTFDGKMIHFQGSCTYVLAEDCEGGDFSIQVTNDDRGRKGVSWTKEATVLIGDVVVQLLQDWVVMVDYQTVRLPFLKEPYIYIERKTNTILLNTNIGVKVQGANHSSSQCAEGEDVDPCKQAGYRARKEANAKCKLLKSKVFERCHSVVPPEMFFASCVYDLCACGANADECLCDALEAYASECRESGVILHWRSPSLCGNVTCPLARPPSVCRNEGELQQITDKVTESAESTGLDINIEKSRLRACEDRDLEIQVRGKQLRNADNFTHLGDTVSRDETSKKEVMARILKAISSFESLERDENPLEDYGTVNKELNQLLEQYEGETASTRSKVDASFISRAKTFCAGPMLEDLEVPSFFDKEKSNPPEDRKGLEGFTLNLGQGFLKGHP